MNACFSNVQRLSARWPGWLLGIMIMTISFPAPCGAAEEAVPAADLPPGQCRVISADSAIRFPFDIYRGDIRFQCEINGHPVHMLLDDGYMWDELLFWGNPRVDSLGFECDGTVGVGGASPDAEKFESRTASGITVRFPNVEFTGQKAVITPSSSGTGSMWAGSEGQISAMFFKHFVVDINFDDMVITLIKPEAFTYDGRGTAVPWVPMGFGPWSIPATLTLADGRDISLKMLMDLGYNDQLELWTGKGNKIPMPDKGLPANLGMNIQGIPTIGNVGRIPRIKIGAYEIDNMLAAFVPEKDGSQSQCEAMVGLGLLSRFNLTFDYSRQRLIIMPNRKFNDAFEYDMSGLTLRRGVDGSLEIEQIYDHSPASDAGLKVGDKLISINGTPAGDVDFFERESLFRQEGTTVRLQAVRDGREWNVALKLRRGI